jgi:predicted site-specific integrase-resolvase
MKQMVKYSEICGVKKKTVSVWLKIGLLKGFDLPSLGQIVEEKDLKQCPRQTEFPLYRVCEDRYQ